MRAAEQGTLQAVKPPGSGACARRAAAARALRGRAPGQHGQRLVPARGERLPLGVQRAEGRGGCVQLRLRGRRLADLLAQLARGRRGLARRPAGARPPSPGGPPAAVHAMAPTPLSHAWCGCGTLQPGLHSRHFA